MTRHDAQSLPAVSAARRECGCPGWAIACLHFDRRLAYICDRWRLKPEIRTQWIRATDKRFYVYPTGTEYDLWDEAFTAFRVAEQRMRDGDL